MENQDVAFVKLYDRVEYQLVEAIKAKLPVRHGGGIIKIRFWPDRKLVRDFRRTCLDRKEFQKELKRLLRMALSISRFQHVIRVNPDGSECHCSTARDISYSAFGMARGFVGIWAHEKNPEIVALAMKA